MVRAAQARAEFPLEGLLVTRYGHLGKGAIGPDVEVIEAGHPIPDANSVRAAQRALALARALAPDDVLLALLSGGGSALLTLPAPGVSLADKQAVTSRLLASGATVADINGVRKHLSAIKGGRLALAAGAARVTSWIISDVAEDDPGLVASGPTLADPTTLEDARAVLESYCVDPPAGVRQALRDPTNETPKTVRGEAVVVARGGDALAAAARLARRQGYRVEDLGDRLQGEARRLGASHAALAMRLAEGGGRHILLSGGETTVTVDQPDGRGGRNLEYLLGLVIALQAAPGIHALAADTDGIDGHAEAAGALVGPDTLDRAHALGLDPRRHLAQNDSHAFFEALGDLVVTGPTLTNVSDFRAILIDR